MNIADVRQEYMRASLDDRDLAAEPFLVAERAEEADVVSLIIVGNL